ncbi:mitochondrial carrier homolog 2-like [Antedon mediterranea]|uniref:mitochondrial carrier homolog 2-like n=1 Tax=Antedon mediterranea TaxID=105859 RepID=UPI003AF771E1
MSESYLDPWREVYHNLKQPVVNHLLRYPGRYLVTIRKMRIEPIPGKERVNIFGKTVIDYSNIFTYANHIRKEDGIIGLYRGHYGLCRTNIIAGFTQMAVKKMLNVLLPPRMNAASDLKAFSIETCKEIASRTVSTIISYPFLVVNTRCLAQFVGKETLYSGWFPPFRHMYNESGISGFFVGLVPELIHEVCCVLILKGMYYLWSNVLDNQTQRTSIRDLSVVSGFFVLQFLLPFDQTSLIMCVSNSGLEAARKMPVYHKWTDCLRDLWREGFLKNWLRLYWGQIPA